MIQLIPLPNNPRERRWLLIIVGETNGFANEDLYFPDGGEALRYAEHWLETRVTT